MNRILPPPPGPLLLSLPAESIVRWVQRPDSNPLPSTGSLARATAVVVRQGRRDGAASTAADATIAAWTLLDRLADVGVLAEIRAGADDHPYNVARRIATLDHLSGGRAGAILVAEPADGDVAAETADVLQRLWRSWPLDAVAVAKDAAEFTRSGAIAPIDHRGPALTVMGPLNVPSTPQGTPVLGWNVAGPAPAGADLVIAGGDADVADGPALVVDAGAAGLDAALRRVDALGDAGIVAGLLLGVEALDPLGDGLDDPRIARRFAPVRPTATLRERMAVAG
jgi:hypothetical protein